MVIIYIFLHKHALLSTESQIYFARIATSFESNDNEQHTADVDIVMMIWAVVLLTTNSGICASDGKLKSTYNEKKNKKNKKIKIKKKKEKST